MLKESLKKGLQAVGYQLSGVFVKTFEEQKLSSKINIKSSVDRNTRSRYPNMKEKRYEAKRSCCFNV